MTPDTNRPSEATETVAPLPVLTGNAWERNPVAPTAAAPNVPPPPTRLQRTVLGFTVSTAALSFALLVVVIGSAISPAMDRWTDAEGVKLVLGLLLIVDLLLHLVTVAVGVAARRTWHGWLAMASPLTTLVGGFVMVVVAVFFKLLLR